MSVLDKPDSILSDYDDSLSYHLQLSHLTKHLMEQTTGLACPNRTEEEHQLHKHTHT